MIAVDICNTLADVNRVLAEDFSVSLQQYPASIPNGFWLSPEGMRVFQAAPPIAGAVEAVSALAGAHGGVVYITSRPVEAEFVTLRWLRMHGFPKGKVVFCGGAAEKVAAYIGFSPSLVAEDDPGVAAAVGSVGIPVVALEWPYNGYLSRCGGAVFVVKGWSAVKEVFALWR